MHFLQRHHGASLAWRWAGLWSLMITVLFAYLSGCRVSNDTTRAPRPAEAAPRDVRSAVPPPLASGRLPTTAIPTHYSLSLVIDPKADRFTGDVSIDVQVPATTSAFVLHGRSMTTIRAEVLVGGRLVPVKVETRAAASGKGDPEELVILLSSPIPAGSAQIRMAYSAEITDQLTGLYHVKEGEDHYAFTQFQPSDARRTFPCFDEPGFKAPFDIKITVPSGNIAVSNGEESERVESSDGKRVTFTFGTTPPLPTYLVAWAVGPFEIRDAAVGPVPLRMITTKGKSALGDEALVIAQAQLALLSDYFDRPYPYPKLDLLAVPEFGYGAMENAGLITFREERILISPEHSSVQARRRMAITIAHELSHHWFGNLVTMAWWDDLWLNEGFATWIAPKIVDQWRPGSEATLEAVADRSSVMDVDALATARPVRRPVRSTSEAEEAFDRIVYDKGAAVLRMLEAWTGEDSFRAGVRSYIADHANGSASSADLFAALSEASKKQLWPVATTFLDQAGLPVVHAELSCNGTSRKVKLSQFRHWSGLSTEQERHATSWRIPVCVAYEGAAGKPVCTVLDAESVELPVPGDRCPRWVYPNAGGNGYFLSSLSGAGFRAVSQAWRQLLPAERASVISSQWALVQSGDLSVDQLMHNLREFAGERDPIVVQQVAVVLLALSDQLVSPPVREAFQRYATALLLPIAKEVGFEARKRDDDKQLLLRRTVLSALTTLSDDPWLRAEAAAVAKEFLADPTSVDTEIATIALRISSRPQGRDHHQLLRARLAEVKTPAERLALVGALSSFADPALLERSLDLVLAGDIRRQDAAYMLQGAMAFPASRAGVIAWMEARFPEIRTRLPGFLVTRFMDSVGVVCDREQRKRIADLFQPGLTSVEGAEGRRAHLLERVQICVSFRDRQGPDVEKALAAY